jgi:hypothetical protein
MSHNPTFTSVSRKAAEQGYEVRQLTEGVFTLRQRLGEWPRLVAPLYVGILAISTLRGLIELIGCRRRQGVKIGTRSGRTQ